MVANRPAMRSGSCKRLPVSPEGGFMELIWIVAGRSARLPAGAARVARLQSRRRLRLELGRRPAGLPRVGPDLRGYLNPAVKPARCERGFDILSAYQPVEGSPFGSARRTNCVSRPKTSALWLPSLPCQPAAPPHPAQSWSCGSDALVAKTGASLLGETSRLAPAEG